MHPDELADYLEACDRAEVSTGTCGDVVAKQRKLHELDLGDTPLANATPEPSLLFTLDELAAACARLQGLEAPHGSDGDLMEVKVKGRWFEAEVARCLGYRTPPKTGSFPDFAHQRLEVKHHTGKAVTVDFGQHHPGAIDLVNGTRVCDVRYLIALAPPPDFCIDTLILATGVEIDSIFGVSPTKTVKYQLGVSARWRAQRSGQFLVSGHPRTYQSS